jgi:hypothetical protein
MGHGVKYQTGKVKMSSGPNFPVGYGLSPPQTNLKRMRKIAWVLIIVLLLAPASRVQAWGWDVHENITDAAYGALPHDIKFLLIPSKIEEGLMAPDVVWEDYPHRFPDKYQPTIDSLEKAKDHYQRGQYSDASFWLGVAAHYIQDMVSLPHCVYGETYEQHVYFESTVARTLPIVTPSRVENFDLYGELAAYNNRAQQKWNSWLATENTVYVQEGLDLAVSLTYNAWYRTLENVVPTLESVMPTEAPSLPLLPVAIAGAVAALVIMVILVWWWRTGSVAVGGHPAKARRWYLYRNNKRYGPYSVADLHRYIAGGRVKEDTLVWRKGMKSWKKISEVKTFKCRFKKSFG